MITDPHLPALHILFVQYDVTLTDLFGSQAESAACIKRVERYRRENLL